MANSNQITTKVKLVHYTAERKNLRFRLVSSHKSVFALDAV